MARSASGPFGESISCFLGGAGGIGEESTGEDAKGEDAREEEEDAREEEGLVILSDGFISCCICQIGAPEGTTEGCDGGKDWG